MTAQRPTGSLSDVGRPVPVSAARPQPQPAKGHLALARISNRTVATRYECSEWFVSRVLNGYLPAPARFRAMVAELLGLSEAACFRSSEPAS